NKACKSSWCEIVHHVLNPGKVGTCTRRNAVLPSAIFAKPLTAPIADIEGWIGKKEICFQLLMEVVMKGISRMRSNVTVNTSNSQIHLTEPPCGRIKFLTIDGEIFFPATIC